MALLPLISEQFGGEIWRMEIDEISETVFVEIRNKDEKKVHFGAVNLTSGNVYFKNIQTSERWLTGIEVAYDGVLLLHNYQSEAGPVHRDLEAIDAVTGKMLWSNYTHAFDHLSQKGPVVYDTRIQPRKLFLADIKTGETTRIYEPSIYKELKNSIVLPEVITADSVPQSLLPLHPFGNTVHYLEYNNFRIVSLQALRRGRLTQSIYIMEGVDKVYEDLLNIDIQKIQPESFIMHKNSLIYIKNKSELKAIAL